jgi:hypothetical protein
MTFDLRVIRDLFLWHTGIGYRTICDELKDWLNKTKGQGISSVFAYVTCRVSAPIRIGARPVLEGCRQCDGRRPMMLRGHEYRYV